MGLHKDAHDDGHFLFEQRRQRSLRNYTLFLKMGQLIIGRHSQKPQGQNKSNIKWLLTSRSFKPAGEIRKTNRKVDLETLKPR